MRPASTVRPARPEDVEALVELVRLLAEYEQEPDAVEMTPAMLHEALFSPSAALFGHVAVDDDSATIMGMALWFVNFSTWRGRHGIHLEDLIVRPEARRRGIGGLLLGTLARVCVERGYGRLEWSVLDWNTPAQDFYRTLGAQPVDGWTTFRLDGAALDAAARGSP